MGAALGCSPMVEGGALGCNPMVEDDAIEDNGLGPLDDGLGSNPVAEDTGLGSNVSVCVPTSWHRTGLLALAICIHCVGVTVAPYWRPLAAVYRMDHWAASAWKSQTQLGCSGSGA